MSKNIRSSLQLNTSGALTSHSPLYFASQPQARSEMTRPAASRLVYISNWKLTSESAKNEPKLRKLLGHLAVYESTSTFTQASSDPSQSPNSESDPNELSTYLHDHVPSFKQFQAAIAEQIATMAQVSSAAAQVTVKEYQSDEEEEEEDDSDYDSYDGDDWSDDEGAAESDGSLTDNEGSEDQSTDAISPMSSCQEEDDADLWAIRPLTSYLTRTAVTCS